MLAFHNDPGIKRKYLTRVLGHQKSDELIKGQYWQNGKGCAVGCTVHSENHMAYETELGIPVAIARLEDRIFENLPNDKAKEWPVRLLNSIHVGADLSMVPSKFLHWLLVNPKDGVIRFAKSKKSVKLIRDVADLYQRKLNGDSPSYQEWRAAYAATAYDATAYDAAVYDAAVYTAYNAYNAAVYDAAKKNHYVIMSDKLIELLENEKPKQAEIKSEIRPADRLMAVS